MSGNGPYLEQVPLMAFDDVLRWIAFLPAVGMVARVDGGLVAGAEAVYPPLERFRRADALRAGDCFLAADHLPSVSGV